MVCALTAAMPLQALTRIVLTCMEAIHPLGNMSACKCDNAALAVLQVATTLPGADRSTHSTLRCARLKPPQQLLTVALVNLDFGIWFAVMAACRV